MKEHVLKGDPQKQRGAVLRFKTLWETRYHVWPRMEERAQKKMCVNDSKKVSTCVMQNNVFCVLIVKYKTGCT